MTPTTNQYRIIIADDHPIVRRGLKYLFKEDPKLIVVGEATNGEELLKLIDSTECDLVILDLTMPKLSGIECLEAIRDEYPKVKTLVLSMHTESRFVKSALEKGISGYAIKDELDSRLLHGIHEIRHGGRYFSQQIISYILNSYGKDNSQPDMAAALSEREKQVISLIVKGYTSKDISDKLQISKRTVDGHRARIKEKLQVETVADLVKMALELEIT